VAIDPKMSAPPLEAAAEGSPIENEISAYRAISRAAIVSVVLGLASVLAFVHPSFAALGVLAILAGAAAKRSIARVPDVLTGRPMADAGIGLALFFTLSALTMMAVQDWIVVREATKFARAYAETLRDGSVEDGMFLQIPPSAREGKTPKQVADEMEAASRGPAGGYETRTKPLRQIKARLVSTPDQAISFLKIDGHAVDGLAVRANAILELKGPASRDFPDPSQFALVRFRGQTNVPGYDWSIEELAFPLRADGSPGTPPPSAAEPVHEAPPPETGSPSMIPPGSRRPRLAPGPGGSGPPGTDQPPGPR